MIERGQHTRHTLEKLACREPREHADIQVQCVADPCIVLAGHRLADVLTQSASRETDAAPDGLSLASASSVNALKKNKMP